MESLEDQIRTPQQVEADDNLLDAITKCLTAYESLEDGFVLDDFVVLTATTKLNPLGVIQTKHPMCFRGGDIPWYRVHGLVEMAKIEIALAMAAGTDNG